MSFAHEDTGVPFGNIALLAEGFRPGLTCCVFIYNIFRCRRHTRIPDQQSTRLSVYYELTYTTFKNAYLQLRAGLTREGILSKLSVADVFY